MTFENRKKQYDGTTIFEMDVTKIDCNDYLYIFISSLEYVYDKINNVTVEFEEYFNIFHIILNYNYNFNILIFLLNYF